MVIAAQFWGCSDEGGVGLGNQPPTVWLSSAPPEGSVSAYTIHLFWGGWDPDGEIEHYEYVITNNETGVFDPADTTSTPGDYKWSRVDANDSTFTFSADLIPDSSAIDFDGGHSPEEFRRSHTFFIRAVDTDGLRSDTPAYRSFTARTLSPTVFVTIPVPSGLNPAEFPPVATFKWTATDYIDNVAQVQDPADVRHILIPVPEQEWDSTLAYIRDHPAAPEWSEWKPYNLPNDEGKSWTSTPLDFGFYLFAAQARDEAGAVSPVFDLSANVRRVVIGPRNSGPILIVTNPFIGTTQTASPNTPPVIVDLPAGVGMFFEFEASAEHYGGLVSGYRYGWDILDLNDDEQWEVDFTPFIGERAQSPARTFFFGTHSFFVEVVDNSGFKSRIEVRINIVPFTMEKDLLFVDDWIEGTSCFAANGGTNPCDAEHKALWAYLLDTVKGFNPNTDVYELGVEGRNELPITTLASYKNMIWTASGNSSGSSAAYFNRMVTFPDPSGQVSGRTTPNFIALYMAAGGHVLVCGNQIMTMVVNPNVFVGRGALAFPIIFRYELAGDQDGTYGFPNNVGVNGVGENSFAYNQCCLNVLDQAYIPNLNQIRREGVNNQRCWVNHVRDRDRVKDGMRAALPIDVTTGGGFPILELRPEVAGPGKFLQSAGLVVDIYNPVYFPTMTACFGVAETIPSRSCFQPIYGNGCSNTQSVIYNAPVGFWTTQYQTRVPDVAGAVGARSAIWGIHPVYFKPDQVKEAVGVVVHDEWKLERN